MTKTENIKVLYLQVHAKTKFIQLVADDLNLNPQYVRGHYFSGFWMIPEYKQDRIIELLQNTIREHK